MNTKSFVAIKNADGTVKLYLRRFSSAPEGYGNVSYEPIRLDVLEGPPRLRGNLGAALQALAAIVAATISIICAFVPLSGGVA